MGILAFFPPPWIEFFICIHVYLLAAFYTLKEIIFEASNQGIEKKLLDDIGKSPLMRNVSNKVALVTGADGTIGSQIVKRLLSYGFTVHALVGNQERASYVFEQYENARVGRQLKIYCLNFEDPFEVADFAKTFENGPSHLDLVIMCAGVMLSKEKFIDRVESHMCVNVTSHALLLEIIKGKLSPNARVLAMSSACAYAAHIPPILEKDNVLQQYIGPYQAYAFSKLAFAVYVHEISQEKKIPIVSMHPGVVPGNLYRNLNIFLRLITFIILPYFLRSSRFSSLLAIHTVLREDFVPGAYYEDCKIKKVYNRLHEEDRSKIYNIINEQVEYWK